MARENAPERRDFEEWEEKNCRWMESRPICDCCGEPIQEEFYYDIDGEMICDGCLLDFLNKYCKIEIED